MVLSAVTLPTTSRLGSLQVTESARPERIHHAVCGTLLQESLQPRIN